MSSPIDVGAARARKHGLPAIAPDYVAVPFADRNVRFGARGPVAPAPGGVQTFRFGVGDDFLVFEPQGVVKFDVVNHITINGGIGYRAVALTDVLRDGVDGATASLGLEFDW